MDTDTEPTPQPSTLNNIKFITYNYYNYKFHLLYDHTGYEVVSSLLKLWNFELKLPTALNRLMKDL